MTWRRMVRVAGLGLGFAAVAGCVSNQQSSTPDTAGASGTASLADPGEWRQLFDGSTLSGWRVYRSQQRPSGWTANEGVLSKSLETDDIITVDQFGDFELEWEWRIAAGGNAGVFYRATEEYERVYWSGPEYQLLDDASAPDATDRRTSAGAAYALYPAPAGKVRPAGQWNHSRIIVHRGRVEHWLNGEKLLEYELGSPDWEAKVKASKFNEWPKFGRAQRGHIAIQGDHAGHLALRNIRIRELRG